jgi:hypothetical protein
MTTPTGKVAIVTGASRGIGAAIAERLAADGFTVLVNFAGGTAAAEALVRKIEAGGGSAMTAQADVSDPAAVARMFDAAEAALGGVDVLVNNAGIMKLATLADSDDALFDSVIAINLKGTFNTLREAARRLRDGGRIINLSSSGRPLPADLCRLRCLKSRGRGADACAGQGDARPQYHGQHDRTRTNGDRSVPRRQAAGNHRASREDGTAGTARPTHGHRRRSRLSSRPGRRVDQRSDAARQWRHHLTGIKTASETNETERKSKIYAKGAKQLYLRETL